VSFIQERERAGGRKERGRGKFLRIGVYFLSLSLQYADPIATKQNHRRKPL